MSTEDSSPKAEAAEDSENVPINAFVADANRSSPAGSLLADLPAYCLRPPIEVVVFGWGVTEDGQLGLDSKQDVHRPSVIESLLGTQFTGFQFNRRPLVAGTRHTLAVTDDGRVLSWGWNDRGTLGLGHRHTTSKPAVVRGLEDEHIVQVAAGGWHCLALTQSGKVYAWGGNEYFQCGVQTGQHNVVVPKVTMPFLNVSMVTCGGMHSIALTTEGEVWQWGEPWGDFTMMEVNRSPRRLNISDVASVASGAFHNLALTHAGQIYAWGTNDFGQLGTGDTTYASQPIATVGFEHTKVADVSAGGWHSLAITVEGEVYTWGRGEYGRLGLNEPKGTAHVRPSRVPGLKGCKIIQAACGGSHTLALSDDGRMFIWGRCSNGRQGFEVNATVEIPHELTLPGGAERWHPICIAAGGRHSLAMALPRQTVDDHERRMTAMSEDMPWFERSLSGVDWTSSAVSGRSAGRNEPGRGWPISSSGSRKLGVGRGGEGEQKMSRSLDQLPGGHMSAPLGATVRVPAVDFLRTTQTSNNTSVQGWSDAGTHNTPRTSDYMRKSSGTSLQAAMERRDGGASGPPGHPAADDSAAAGIQENASAASQDAMFEASLRNNQGQGDGAGTSALQESHGTTSSAMDVPSPREGDAARRWKHGMGGGGDASSALTFDKYAASGGSPNTPRLGDAFLSEAAAEGSPGLQPLGATPDTAAGSAQLDASSDAGVAAVAAQSAAADASGSAGGDPEDLQMDAVAEQPPMSPMSAGEEASMELAGDSDEDVSGAGQMRVAPSGQAQMDANARARQRHAHS